MTRKEQFIRFWPWAVLPLHGLLVSSILLRKGFGHTIFYADSYPAYILHRLWEPYFLYSWAFAIAQPYSYMYLFGVFMLFFLSCRAWRRAPNFLTCAGTFFVGSLLFGLPAIFILEAIYKHLVR